VASCSTCDAPVQRVFHPVAVHFKGSGFYTTDYGRKGGSGATSEGSSSDGEGKKAESKGSSELKGSESKPSAASSSD
jgi:hypothetical protein